MKHITCEKDLQDVWENLHHLLWSNEGFTPEKAMDHLNLIFYIKMLEPHIDDQSINLPDICKFSTLASIQDANRLFETFKRDVIPELIRFSPEYFSQFRIRKPDNLYKLIQHINRIDLNNTDRDFLGHIYEYIIGRGTSSMSDDGQYFTNRPICRYVMKLVDPHPRSDSGDIFSMIDPFCGTGGFLTQYATYMMKNSDIKWDDHKNHIYGVDIKIGSVMTSLINLMFSTGFSFSTDNIVHKHSFYDTLFNGKKFDYIFTNPPFGGDQKKGEQFRFKYAQYTGGTGKSGRPIKGSRVKTLVSSAIESIHLEIDDKVDCAVMLCMALLAPGGTAAIVLPEGFFFGSGKKRIALRKKLIENFNVKYVVSIPQDAFDNTSTKTSILVFQQGSATSTVEFLDFDANYEKKQLATASVPMLRENNFSLRHILYVKKKWNLSSLSDEYKLYKLGDICEIQYGTRITKKNSQGSLYPVYGGGDKTYSTDTYNREGDTCKIGRFGVSKENCVMIISEKYYLNDSGFTVMSKDENICLTKYLWYQLLRIREDIANCVRGTAQGNIDITAFKNLQIPLPSLHHQQEQIDRLSYIDMAIQAKKLLQLMETAAMAEVKNLQKHPQAKRVMLRSLLECHNTGKTSSGKVSNTGEYLFYSGKATNPSGTHSSYDFDGDNYFLFVKGGGNAIRKCGRNLGIGKFYMATGKTAGNAGVVKFTSKNCCHRYLYYYLSAILEDIQLLAKYTTGLGHISTKDVLALHVFLPPLQIQQTMEPLFNQIDIMKNNIVTWTKQADEIINTDPCSPIGMDNKSNNIESSDSESSDSDSDSSDSESSDSESSE